MTDVCPFSLGVATYSRQGDKTPHMAVLIPRSSMLPASHRGAFYTLYDNQHALRFEIYQGEGYFASENLKLGEVEVQVPPGPAGESLQADGGAVGPTGDVARRDAIIRRLLGR